MMKGLLRAGAMAGVIKLSGAGLAYLTFVAIAKVTDVRSFGVFGTVFSAASLLSYIFTFGQQSAVLRYWPQSYADGRGDLANGYLLRSLRVLLAGTGVSLLSVLAIILLGNDGGDILQARVLAAAWLLLLTLTWAEFLSAALRARGSIYLSLLPRDVLWRMLVILTAALIYMSSAKLPASAAIVTCAGLLFLSIAPQAVSICWALKREPICPLSISEKQDFNRVSLGLWGVTSLPPAMGQASVLLVAAMLGPEMAGGVFAAERTARLVVLGLNGINQVLAPEIAGSFHQKQFARVQAISSATAIASTLFASLAVGIFLGCGSWILGMFNATYRTTEMLETLIVFGVGQLGASAAGPTGLLLQLTGREQRFLKILALVNAAGLALTYLCTKAYGPLGAAASISVTLLAWNAFAVVDSCMHLRIDPSVLSALRSVWPASGRLKKVNGR